MGRRGPTAKAKDEQGRAIPGTVAVQVLPRPQVPARRAPEAPSGLHLEARRAWRDFWSSQAAQWVDSPGHLARLRRWARDLDMYHRVLEDLHPAEAGEGGADPQARPGVIDPQRPWLGRGSTRQITVHPNAELLDRLEQRIHRAEVEFGMTPYAAVRLAGSGVQGALTAEQLRRLMAEGTSQQPSEQGEAWAQGLAPAPEA